MVGSEAERGRVLTALCIGLGLLLTVELFVWFVYFLTVGTDRPGHHSNTAPAMTGPFFGPSTVNGYGVPSRGRDVSEAVAAVMAALNFCAVIGLAIRSAALRSRAFTAMALAHTLLFLWALFLGTLGYGFMPMAPWFALILAFCAAIRRVAPVRTLSA